jgi:transposase-like protein
LREHDKASRREVACHASEVLCITVFLTINGPRSYLWRAVDQEGNILDRLVQRRRAVVPPRK